VVVVLAASVQDPDGAKTTLLRSHAAAPRARFTVADGAFARRLLDWAARILSMTIAVVRKPAGQHGFAVIPAAGRWLRSDDPMGLDQHHDPAPGPRRLRHLTRATAPHINHLTASRTRSQLDF
jgi:hypothetical protein